MNNDDKSIQSQERNLKAKVFCVLFAPGFGPIKEEHGLDVVEIFAGSHRIQTNALECGLQATAFDVVRRHFMMTVKLILRFLPDWFEWEFTSKLNTSLSQI